MVEKIKIFVKRVTKLDIVKVFSLTSVSTLIRMIAGFVSVKVVSVIIGPSGVALIGQLSNFSTIMLTLATGGITSGVTKYVSEFKDDKNTVKSYIGSSVKITLFFSVICSVALILGSSFFSQKILLDKKYTYVFIVFGLTIFFYSLNNLLLSIINAYKYFSLYVKISIVSSIFGLCLSLALVIPFGINGALLNAVTSQSLVFLVLIIWTRKQKLFFLSKSYILNKIDTKKVSNYIRYSLMTIVGTFGVPVGQLVLRSYVIGKFGITDAGCWEGMNRLSNMYLMVIISSFSVYYMPRLSELKDNIAIKHEIVNAYKLIVPFLLVEFSAIYFMREFIIKILFSSDFGSMVTLFKWQLFGDFFKITSWLIAFLMVAKARTTFFCITEMVFSLLYVVLAYIFTTSFGFGLEGVVIGYMCNYIIYLIVMYLFIWRKLKMGINC